LSVLPEGHDGYQGPATLEAGSALVACDVVITGFFEPIAGRYRWYGRARGAGLDTLPAKDVVLRTPHGTAVTTLADADPWGRYRLQGFGRPPFPVAGVEAGIGAEAEAGVEAGADAVADGDR
jgi:hypothetical protein